MVEGDAIAEGHLRRYCATFEALVDWTEAGLLPEARVHHSHFEDFQRDALAVVRGLYTRFQRPWNADTEAAMAKALGENPANRYGGHAYPLDGLGADPQELRAAFARYRACFDVAPGG